jgi:hypothetical protein
VSAAGVATAAGRCKLVWRYAITGGVPRRSLIVTAIVGTLLNLINQGDRLVTGHSFNLAKLALTYIVPYFVSTYGAVSFRLEADKISGRHR